MDKKGGLSKMRHNLAHSIQKLPKNPPEENVKLRPVQSHSTYGKQEQIWI